jgi:hypothetical protein
MIQVVERIVNDPCFIEAVAHELRGEKESSSGDDEDSEDDEDDIGRRVRHRILLRMKQRYAKRQRV